MQAVAAAAEQLSSSVARNAQATALATNTVTRSIAGVGLVANDAGATASQVLSSASDLSRQAESLSGEVVILCAACGRPGPGRSASPLP